MNESSRTYYGPPSDTTPHTATGGSLSPEALNELRKMRKSMRRMEKLLKGVCLLLLENQRMYQMEADYGNLFNLGANRQKRRYREPKVPFLDVLD